MKVKAAFLESPASESSGKSTTFNVVGVSNHIHNPKVGWAVRFATGPAKDRINVIGKGHSPHTDIFLRDMPEKQPRHILVHTLLAMVDIARKDDPEALPDLVEQGLATLQAFAKSNPLRAGEDEIVERMLEKLCE